MRYRRWKERRKGKAVAGIQRNSTRTLVPRGPGRTRERDGGKLPALLFCPGPILSPTTKTTITPPKNLSQRFPED